MTDAELIEQHRSGSPDAFAELVRRHVEWVHSVAQRRVRDSSLADDVTQATFILLARKLPRLKPGQTLSAWLFPVANFASKQALRIEFRRRVRETEAAKMREQQLPHDSEPDPWNELASMLDELVGRLKSHDRQAVLLRFYERKTFPEIGQTMQISEEAARKRVSRAVEQLRQLYAGKGVAVGAAALTASLAANLTQPVSAAVIAGASAAPAGLTASSTSLAPLLKGVGTMLTWASLKPIAAVIGCVLAVSAVTVVAIQEAGSPQKSAVAATPATAPAMRHGRILTLDDKPVPNARVWQMQYSALTTQTSIVATATADADGRFRLPITDKSADILIQPPGFAWMGGTIRSTTPDDPDELRALPGASLQLKFVGPDDKPAPNVRLRLGSASAPGRRGSAYFLEDLNEPGIIQTTDAEGRCTFTDLPRGGRVYLRVLDERFAELDYSDQAELGDSESTDGPTIHLKPGSSISGKVVYGDSGKPAEGVRVYGRSERSGTFATTDAQGHYELKQLSAGRYVLLAYLKDEISRQYEAPALEGLRLLAGVKMEDQNLTLTTGGIVRGKITEQGTGKPIKGMRVLVVGPSNPESAHMSVAATTGEDGTYVIHVAPGAQRVQFFSLPPPPEYRQPRELSREVTVAEGQSVDVDYQLPRSGAVPVTGKAVDSAGHPMAGVEIYVQPKDESPPGEVETITDTAGNFSIPVADPASRLRARKGRWTTIQPVAPRGQNLTLTLVEDGFASLRFTVHQADGAAVPGARVELVDGAQGGGVVFGQRSTGPDGTCVFRRLDPDVTYQAYVFAKGFGNQNLKVSIQPGKLLDVPTIILPKADSFVAGMVVDDMGNPMVDMMVNMHSSGFGRSGRTDATGHFRFDGIVPGDAITVSAMIDDRTVGATLRNVPAGSDNLVITVRPPATRPVP